MRAHINDCEENSVSFCFRYPVIQTLFPARIFETDPREGQERDEDKKAHWTDMKGSHVIEIKKNGPEKSSFEHIL